MRRDAVSTGFEGVLMKFLLPSGITPRFLESYTDEGVGRYRERREKERQQLADLVGKNLTYISQLEGLDFPLYKVRGLCVPSKPDKAGSLCE